MGSIKELHHSDLMDAFGVPDVFVTGVIRERICNELVRLIYFADEGGHRVVKAKVLIPIATMKRESLALRNFITELDADGPIRIM